MIKLIVEITSSDSSKFLTSDTPSAIAPKSIDRIDKDLSESTSIDLLNSLIFSLNTTEYCAFCMLTNYQKNQNTIL